MDILQPPLLQVFRCSATEILHSPVPEDLHSLLPSGPPSSISAITCLWGLLSRPQWSSSPVSECLHRHYSSKIPCHHAMPPCYVTKDLQSPGVFHKILSAWFLSPQSLPLLNLQNYLSSNFQSLQFHRCPQFPVPQSAGIEPSVVLQVFRLSAQTLFTAWMHPELSA